MEKHLIYGLFDPTDESKEVRYVGYTSKGLKQRIKEHVSEAKAKNTCYRHRWLRALIVAGVKVEAIVLEEVDATNWQERERHWIAELYGPRLTNSTEGGEGLVSPSAEIRAKIGIKVSALLVGNQRRKGVPHTDETKGRMSATRRVSEKVRAGYEARKGRQGPKHSEETKQKIRELKLGKKHPPRSMEWKAKQSAAHTGKIQNPETIAKRAAKQIGNTRALGNVMSEVAKAAIAESRKGRRAANNGTENRYLLAGEELPQGWSYGFKKKVK